MLVQFSVGNYRSFKEVVHFSMVAAKIKSKDSSLDANSVFEAGNNMSLLKSAAVYGANASGKSNLITAMRFMKWFVRNSSKETRFDEPIDFEPFRLSTEMAEHPSFFEVIFLLDGIRYRYGFEVNLEKVVSEWLHFVPTTREVSLFERDSEGIHVKKRFHEGRGIEEKTRKNALFLSVVAQFNGRIAQTLLRWFTQISVISGLDDLGYRHYTLKKFYEGDYRHEILKLIQDLDVGIDDIYVEKGSRPPLSDKAPEELKSFFQEMESLAARTVGDNQREQYLISMIHQKFDGENIPVAVEQFDLREHESQGTQKLFALTGPLVDTLKKGRILVIDELDARLHPLITCQIISLFNSQQTNPHNAQLVFTTHDTNLLNNKLLRRDQIWFTEKDRYGATHLYSLVEYKVEYKGVRNDASYEKDYIQGRYGAIPFIGDLGSLFGESDA